MVALPPEASTPSNTTDYICNYRSPLQLSDDMLPNTVHPYLNRRKAGMKAQHSARVAANFVLGVSGRDHSQHQSINAERGLDHVRDVPSQGLGGVECAKYVGA